jgi:2-pyrone-4,6-dicarboxylate lactonase
MPLTLPPNACNAHCHVFGPRDRFPYVASGSFIPERDAPKEALFQLNDQLGLKRCVIVQSTCHGFDNRATEDAIAARPKSYRGVALLRTDVSDEELLRLDGAGFRGVRFNYMKHAGSGVPMDQVLRLAARIAPLGWHLMIHGDASLLTELGPSLRRSPVPVIIDHIGRVDASLGQSQDAFQALLAVMSDTRFWAKVSGIDRISRTGPPYEDALPFARRLVAGFGDRVLWGNDWPHPNHAGPLPDERQLVELIAEMAPTESDRSALLVDNPQRLYRFSEDLHHAE